MRSLQRLLFTVYFYYSAPTASGTFGTGGAGGGECYIASNPSLSYNTSTGILKRNNGYIAIRGSGVANANISLSARSYCIYLK